MITKIRYRDDVPVEIEVGTFGLLPGTYNINDLSADDLMTERRMLIAKRLTMSPHDPQLTEHDLLENCLARVIDLKCAGGKK